MVNQGSTAHYESLDAVLADKEAQVCIWSSVRNDALLHYPPLWSHLLSKPFGTSAELLRNLTVEYSESSCNAVIIPISDYEIAVSGEPSICKKTKVLPSDDFSFDISTVLFISPHLSYSDELLEVFDKNMINGKYASIFQFHFEMFEEKEFNMSAVEELYKTFDYNTSKVLEYHQNKNRGGRFLVKAISTSSSSANLDDGGEYHIGYCDKDTFQDDNAAVLSLGELAFPLLFTFICSSIGLFSYLFSKCKKSVGMKYVKDDLTDEETAKLRVCAQSSGDFQLYEQLHQQSGRENKRRRISSIQEFHR